jgi:hypothetical protein
MNVCVKVKDKKGKIQNNQDKKKTIMDEIQM